MFIFIFIIFILALGFVIKQNRKSGNNYSITKVYPVIADIRLTVTTTGVLDPQNRLEIKPSINGRIEEIFVQEGESVVKGELLVKMSSTERAALVDAARAQDEESLKYWQEVYKQTPIVSPIDGEVIVRSVEPGQTVTTNDPILVLSDRLIVKAQFDETDIGKLEIGQKAIVKLDAYPDVKIEGKVDHIAYESQLVNNVNIYDVDILPETVPKFFRSGMSANIEVVEKEGKSILTIPVDALSREKDKTFVYISRNGVNRDGEKKEIQVGISDEKNVEVVSGLSLNDLVVLKGKGDIFQDKETGTNPFMPFRGKRK